MRRALRCFCLSTIIGFAAFAPSIGVGAVVGKWTMEVDDIVGDADPTGANLSVPDSSGMGGSPFTTDQGILVGPGANGTANGADGFDMTNATPNRRNIDGRILSYEALNSASVRVSGYFRSDEAGAQLIGRSDKTNLTIPGTKGFSIESPNSVLVDFYVGGVQFVLNSNPVIDLSFGTNEAPAWTKITFSYNATSGVASLFANDQPRGTLTAPGGGPMFVEFDVLDITIGNGAITGGGFDGGGGGENAGPIVDELVYENSVGATPTFREADFDENGVVAAADLTRWRTNFGTGTTHLQGNANGDGDVDGNDFLVWQSQLGLTSPTVTGVPEPGSAALVAAGTLFAAAAGRRPRRGTTISL